jgi:hypothetical protein
MPNSESGLLAPVFFDISAKLVVRAAQRYRRESDFFVGRRREMLSAFILRGTRQSRRSGMEEIPAERFECVAPSVHSLASRRADRSKAKFSLRNLQVENEVMKQPRL